MIDAIESNVMVKPLNGTSNFKHKNADKSNHDSLNANIKQIAALLSCLPEVDQARVDFFKEEIASGRYHILSDQIAAKMIADFEMA
ncbi:MAG: flagellar biosynthesis anti-sigma factor FlgM [Tatlockia sp.]|nr:flagellar biosynthesis anti-sigma factor FlgM [Tatlockia sp.]